MKVYRSLHGLEHLALKIRKHLQLIISDLRILYFLSDEPSDNLSLPVILQLHWFFDLLLFRLGLVLYYLQVVIVPLGILRLDSLEPLLLPRG